MKYKSLWVHCPLVVRQTNRYHYHQGYEKRLVEFPLPVYMSLMVYDLCSSRRKSFGVVNYCYSRRSHEVLLPNMVCIIIMLML
jgi:hypothetical protein